MKQIGLLLFGIILGISAFGQIMPIEYDHYTRFEHLSVADGLPGNHVTVIRTDSSGYIWIGTREGLARYDGTRFETFYHKPEDSTSIASNYITDILVSSEQKVFVGTREGLSIFEPQTFSFIQVPILFEKGLGLQDKHIRALLQADDQHIWVETNNGILHLLNTKTFNTRSWPHNKPSQPYYDYHTLYEDSKKELWIGGRNMGPLRMKNGLIKSVKTNNSIPNLKRERDAALFFEDSHGDFWVGGFDGLYQLDRENETVNKRLHTSSYDMVESYDGSLWVATGRGLACINKKENSIVKYLPTGNDLSSIIHDHINCLNFDHAGNLWIGTQQGISILKENQSLIRYYRHMDEIPNSLSNNHISCFMEDKKGAIWIGTMGGGLNRFNSENHSFESFSEKKASEGSTTSDRVSAIFEDTDGSFWTGLWQGTGFNHFDPEQTKYTRFALDSSSLKSDWYSGFETIGKDTLVVGFWGAEGIRLFSKSKKQWLDYCFRPLQHPGSGEIQHVLSNDSLIWLYQSANILHSYSPSGEDFKAFRTNTYAKLNNRQKIKSVNLPDFSTVNDIIRCGQLTFFLTDKGLVRSQGGQFKTISPVNFSIGAHTQTSNTLCLLSDNGLWSYDIRENHFTEIISSKTLPTPFSNINDLLILPNNKLLFGTSSGLIMWDLKTGSSTSLPTRFSAKNLPNHPIRKIFKINEDILLIYTRGLAYLPAEGNIRFYNTRNSFKKGLRNDAINFALPTLGGDGVWLGADKGLYFFSPSNGHFKLIPEFNNFAINEMVYYKNQLYIATDQGLAKIDPQSEKATFLNSPPNDKLSSHLTTFVKKDQEGFIWTGTTNNGINRINPHTLKVDHYCARKGFRGTEAQAFLQTSTGEIFAGGDSLNVYNKETDSFEVPNFARLLPNEKILSLTEGPKGRIIIVTSHNIFIYLASLETLFNLTPYLGSENITFTSASLKTSANDVYIGTVRGFFKFEPALFNTPSNIKTTQITKVSVMGDPIQLTKTPKLALNHNENMLQISFSDMVFPPDHDRYLFKLEPTDEEWITTREASVTYKLLPPGNYNFRVKTLNPFGDSQEAMLQINIKPPFYRTWWFLILLILAIAGSFTLWWRQRLNHLEILENNLNLKHRLLLSQMNPHFMFNALSAIQSFIYQNQPQTAGGYLSKFAKLMRLYLNNMASPTTPISDEAATLRHYLELQQLRFNGAFKYSMKVLPEQDNLYIGIPAMMVQPFVENAVEHGIQHIEYEGNIEIIFSLKNNTWDVTIRDNGIGLEKSRLLKSEFRSSHKSMSMEITRKRIDQLKKQYKQPCQLTIKDKTQEPGSQTGTEVNLTVPAIPLSGN